MSQLTAAYHHIPVRYIWQPSRFTKPYVVTEPHHPTEWENHMRRVTQDLPSLLPSDMINLTDALSALSGPLYTDDVHHSERGTVAVGQRLFAALEPQLRDLASKPAPPVR